MATTKKSFSGSIDKAIDSGKTLYETPCELCKELMVTEPGDTFCEECQALIDAWTLEEDHL